MPGRCAARRKYATRSLVGWLVLVSPLNKEKKVGFCVRSPALTEVVMLLICLYNTMHGTVVKGCPITFRLPAATGTRYRGPCQHHSMSIMSRSAFWLSR